MNTARKISYLIFFLIIAGVAVYMWTEEVAQQSQEHSTSTIQPSEEEIIETIFHDELSE
ncbi:hypothetical protein KC866_00800 [Patescibacteria group bacterium]|nr:hypothetical protein [Patescibacteria group bacterium]